MQVIRGRLSRSHHKANAATRALTITALLAVAFPATAAAAHTPPAHAHAATSPAPTTGSRDTHLDHAILALGAGYATPSGSPQVRALQHRLAHAGYTPDGIDGIFGPRTRHAVTAFQAAHRLQPDGIAGPRTWAALATPTLILGPGAADSPADSSDVRSLQHHLAAAGDPPGPIDGQYGPLTQTAVTRFQRSHHLHVNGIAAPPTLTLLAKPTPPPTHHSTPPRPAHHSTPPRPAHHSTPASPAPRTAPAPVTHPAVTAPGTGSVPWNILIGLGLAVALIIAAMWYLLSPGSAGAATMSRPRARVVRTHQHTATTPHRTHTTATSAVHDHDAHVQDTVATSATVATHRHSRAHQPKQPHA